MPTSMRHYISNVSALGVFAFSILIAVPLLSGFPVLNAEESGQDFIDEAKWVYRTLACGEGEIPAGVDTKARDEHCRQIEKKAETYKKNFLDHFIQFMGKVRPRRLPSVVVYPFGGSDLYTALAAYPASAEIITISLESAGDPRRLPKAGPDAKMKAMGEFRKVLLGYFACPDNSNDMVRALERGLVPGQLSLSLAAAAYFGLEPVSLKYFRIEPDGKLHYYTLPDIASMENTKGKKLQHYWIDTDFSIAFRSMEIIYKRRGMGTGARTVVHRHVSANLSDGNFKDSPLAKFLETKGKFASLTKGASYLLWRKDFSVIRKYLLSNMVFMVSDCTGILPHHAREAGFEQVTYGTFHAAFLDNKGGADAEEFRKFFGSQPLRPIPFRFGYADILGANHLIITQPASASKKIK